MRYCDFCGRPVLDVAVFCRSCGQKLPEVPAPVQAEPQSVPDIPNPAVPAHPARTKTEPVHQEGPVGQNCPFCQMPIKPGLAVAVCPECGISHHAECWRENGDKCTTYGCKGKGAVPPVMSAVSPVRSSAGSIELSADCPVRPDMVLVQGGVFSRGDTFGDGNKDERPVHTVRLNSFYIAKFPVTFADFDRFCDNSGRVRPFGIRGERGDRPVLNVSWQDAVLYCNWLSRSSGYELCYDSMNLSWNYGASGYRLPREAEWEFAARGGSLTHGCKFSGSSNVDEVAWYKANSGGEVQPVGKKLPNELGVYDMSGNVWEWCWDVYEEKYSVDPLRMANPHGAVKGSVRVKRGGCWASPYSDLRVARRSFDHADATNIHTGFRLVRSTEA